MGIKKIKDGPRINLKGIGGTLTPFYFHEIEILVGRYQVRSKVGFSTTDNIGATGILGQLGFFEHFVISYHYKQNYIEIKKADFIQQLISKIPFSNSIFI